jgi:hypothetical protein
MPTNPALAASGQRDPAKPRPIPTKIRAALELMVFGKPDDEDCTPLGFIEAAKECGIAPDIMRRWLDRAQVRAYLLGQRRAFRAAICAGNEGALADIRDKAANSMARVAAIRTLEQMDEEGGGRQPAQQSPGVTIRIIQRALPPIVDVTSNRPMTIDGHRV